MWVSATSTCISTERNVWRLVINENLYVDNRALGVDTLILPTKTIRNVRKPVKKILNTRKLKYLPDNCTEEGPFFLLSLLVSLES